MTTIWVDNLRLHIDGDVQITVGETVMEIEDGGELRIGRPPTLIEDPAIDIPLMAPGQTAILHVTTQWTLPPAVDVQTGVTVLAFWPSDATANDQLESWDVDAQATEFWFRDDSSNWYTQADLAYIHAAGDAPHYATLRVQPSPGGGQAWFVVDNCGVEAYNGGN